MTKRRKTIPKDVGNPPAPATPSNSEAVSIKLLPAEAERLVNLMQQRERASSRCAAAAVLSANRTAEAAAAVAAEQQAVIDRAVANGFTGNIADWRIEGTTLVITRGL